MVTIGYILFSQFSIYWELKDFFSPKACNYLETPIFVKCNTWRGYSRYIFWGRNAQSSLGTKQEKGRVEYLWEFQIFYQGIMAQIFGKNICYFKSPISPWRGPQSKSLFWAFFLNSLWSPSTKKSALTEPPFLLFQTFCIISANFVLEMSAANFWVKNLGHNLLRDHLILTKIFFFSEK